LGMEICEMTNHTPMNRARDNWWTLGFGSACLTPDVNSRGGISTHAPDLRRERRFAPLARGLNNEIISAMMECYFPSKFTNARQSYKPWITQSLKGSICKRQKRLNKYGKNSVSYKYWRKKVQRDAKPAREKYYNMNSFEKLKNSNPSRWWKEGN
jgi:hypothetical protein